MSATHSVDVDSLGSEDGWVDGGRHVVEDVLLVVGQFRGQLLHHLLEFLRVLSRNAVPDLPLSPEMSVSSGQLSHQ